MRITITTNESEIVDIIDHIETDTLASPLARGDLFVALVEILERGFRMEEKNSNA